MREALCDRFGRRITTLRVSVTDRCNLRCRYCMPAGGVRLSPRAALLCFEEIAQVVAAAADLGVYRIKLTGGEPLLRRDLERLVAMIAAIASIEDLSLTTNGTLLAPLGRALRDAGLQRVTVSLDTLRRERFRRVTGGDLKAVLAGIEAADRAGLAPIKINVVALRGVNDDEFSDFARLTLDRPIEVRFIELMPIGHCASVGPEHFMPAAEVRDRLQAIGALVPVVSSSWSGPAQRFRFAGARGTVGFIAPITEPFCERCNRLRLTSHGVLRACLLAGGEVALKPALRPRPDGEALRAAFRDAVALKPARHAGRGVTPMSLIGG